MTVMAPPPPTQRTAVDPSPAAPTAGRGGRRGKIAVVLAASLALSGVTRYWADAKRTADLNQTGGPVTSTTSLSSMNSFALGLLLGGLRGPLVMILWTDSENQKTEKNLEGVDTEIEWIRLLQPEFDTVHLFQIWNKAYNISVQMASLANKYDTILGALDYARSVDQQKPNDINILGAIGQLHFDKLGTSSEKGYYRRRVREESMPHPTDPLRKRDAGWRRITADPVLDGTFHILPSARAELPWLVNDRYAPYTDGVSTFAFAFNYYKRCEQLLNNQHQHHDQLSDVVIDSRPGLSLKNWADDEVEQGRRREAQAVGVTTTDEAAPSDLLTESDTLDHPVADRAALAVATADYDRVTRLVPDALDEYRRHIKNYPDRAQQYQLYMEEITAEQQMATGDRDFLRAMVAAPADRPPLLKVARDAYQRGRIEYDKLALRYYTDYRVQLQILPKGVSLLPTAGQTGLDDLPDDQVLKIEAAARVELAKLPAYLTNNSDRLEYMAHVERAEARLATIDAALGGTPATQP